MKKYFIPTFIYINGTAFNQTAVISGDLRITIYYIAELTYIYHGMLVIAAHARSINYTCRHQ